ncbi:endonuclease/exonuclease/phosphatase family protein [Myxococcota bacterium]|nr:endonuclease/exonuclease/phosphatase family protein [Myxococcota bacterium]
MELRVVTFNAWALPTFLAPKAEARMRGIGERLGPLEADVVALQEIWTEGARRMLVREGRRAGLHHIWHNASAMRGGGLVVLSRHPIRKTTFERFAIGVYPRNLTHIDYIGGKGFVRLELETPSGPIDFIDTHLHARYHRDVEHTYRPHRVGQIVQMSDLIRRSVNPVVAAGDFNFEESTAEYRILEGLTGLRDVAAELNARQATISPGNSHRTVTTPERRVDLIYCRDGADRVLRGRSCRLAFDFPISIDGDLVSLSDHAGVLADIEVAGRGESFSLPAPVDPSCLEIAEKLLRDGREHSAQGRVHGKSWASAGLVTAGLAVLSSRARALSRRRLLRSGLVGLGLAALAPSVSRSLLEEWVAPQEVRAFDHLIGRLGRLSRDHLSRS